MKEIPLTQGFVAFVDDEDFEKVSQFKWYAKISRGVWYAMRSVRLNPPAPNGQRQTTLLMHRFILGLEADDPREVDHREQVETLNNQRANLRICTRVENRRNSRKPAHNTTGFKGTTLHSGGKYQAGLHVHGKFIYGGLFASAKAAALKYNELAQKHYGAFAELNSIPGGDK